MCCALGAKLLILPACARANRINAVCEHTSRPRFCSVHVVAQTCTLLTLQRVRARLRAPAAGLVAGGLASLSSLSHPCELDSSDRARARHIPQAQPQPATCTGAICADVDDDATCIGTGHLRAEHGVRGAWCWGMVAGKLQLVSMHACCAKEGQSLRTRECVHTHAPAGRRLAAGQQREEQAKRMPLPAG